MIDYLYGLAFAWAPAGGHFAGGVAAERIPTAGRLWSDALHAAAGLVVAVELMPQAVGAVEDHHPSAFLFIGGFALFTLVASYFERLGGPLL